MNETGNETASDVFHRHLGPAGRRALTLACAHSVTVILRQHPRAWKYWQAEDGVSLPLLLLAPGYRHRPVIRLCIRVRRGGFRAPRLRRRRKGPWKDGSRRWSCTSLIDAVDAYHKKATGHVLELMPTRVASCRAGGTARCWLMPF